MGLQLQVRTRQLRSPSQEANETSKWSMSRLPRQRNATAQQSLEAEGARASLCSVGVLNSSVSPFQNMPPFARPDEARCTSFSGGNEKKQEDIRQLVKDVSFGNPFPAAVSPRSVLRDTPSLSKAAKGKNLQSNATASDRLPRPRRKEELQGTKHSARTELALSPPQLRPGRDKVFPASSPQLKSVTAQDTEQVQLHRLVTASNDTAVHEQGHRSPRTTWVETATDSEKCEHILKR